MIIFLSKYDDRKFSIISFILNSQFYHIWNHQTLLYEILDGLDRMVKEGKTRYIGISNCFAWQLCRANDLAEREGFAKFVSVQSTTT